MTTAIGEFCWNELATADVKKAKDFYGKVFGWQFSEYTHGEMTYTLIKLNDKEFGGIWQIPTEKQNEIPPHWMAYILVKDAAAALEKAKQHGATEVKPVTQAGEMGRFAIIVDPTGAHVAVWEPSKQ
jgi:uncharacterized protein